MAEHHHTHQHDHHTDKAPGEHAAKDPVCGNIAASMAVKPGTFAPRAASPNSTRTLSSTSIGKRNSKSR